MRRASAAPVAWIAVGATGLLLLLGGLALAGLVAFLVLGQAGPKAASAGPPASAPTLAPDLTAKEDLAEDVPVDASGPPTSQQSLAEVAPADASAVSTSQQGSKSTKTSTATTGTNRSTPTSSPPQTDPGTKSDAPKDKEYVSSADRVAQQREKALAPRDVTIESNPTGAQLTFDGRPMGTTPVIVRKLVPGTYTVTLSREGYETKTYSFVVHNDLTHQGFTLPKKLQLPENRGK